MIRLRIAILALLAAVILIWPSTDCSNLTKTECERAELIDAGAVD